MNSYQTPIRISAFSLFAFTVALIFHPYDLLGLIFLVGIIPSLFFLGYFAGCDRTMEKYLSNPIYIAELKSSKPRLVAYQEWEKEHSFDWFTSSSSKK